MSLCVQDEVGGRAVSNEGSKIAPVFLSFVALDATQFPWAMVFFCSVTFLLDILYLMFYLLIDLSHYYTGMSQIIFSVGHPFVIESDIATSFGKKVLDATDKHIIWHIIPTLNLVNFKKGFGGICVWQVLYWILGYKLEFDIIHSSDRMFSLGIEAKILIHQQRLQSLLF